MMPVCAIGNLRELRDGAEDLRSDGGVLPNLGEFLVCQPARFVDNRVRNTDLADIMLEMIDEDPDYTMRGNTLKSEKSEE